MNPYLALMGFFIALSMSLPASSARPARNPDPNGLNLEWQEIRVVDERNSAERLFFIPKAEMDSLKAQKEGVRDVYERKNKFYWSGVRLWKNRQGHYWLADSGRVLPHPLMPGMSAAQTGYDARRKALADKLAPEASSSDRDKVEATLKGTRIGASMGPRRARMEGALIALLKNHPKIFAELSAMSAEQRDKFLQSGPVAKIFAERKEPASIAKALEELMNSMPQRAVAAAGEAPLVSEPTAKAVDDKDALKNDTINALKEKIASNAGNIRAHIAKRFQSFILSKKGKDSYLAEGALKGEQIEAIAREWIDRQAQADAYKVAVLYFVMGDPDPPKMDIPALDSLKQKSEPRKKFEDELDKALRIFTENGEGTLGYKGPYKTMAGGLQGWWMGFFDSAAESAHVIRNRNIEEIKQSIAMNQAGSGQDGANPPQASPGGGAKIIGRVRQLGLEDLYHKGGRVIEVEAKGAAPATLSIKIYTRRDAKNQPVIHEIGIFDIRNPGMIKGRRFSPQGRGNEMKFVLHEGMKNAQEYELKVSVDGNIQLGVKGGKENLTEGLTVDELFRARHAEAERGEKIEINGSHYRVVGQGGAKGTLLFFRSDAKGKLAGYGEDPELMSEVSEVALGGRTRPISDPTPVGFIGKAGEDKKNFFYSSWNSELRYFEVKPCDGKELSCGWPAPAAPSQGRGGAAKPAAASPSKDKQGTPAGAQAQTGQQDFPADGPAAVGGYSKECKLGEQNYNYNLVRREFKGGWVVFQKKEGSNVFQLCLNQENTIYTAGILVDLKEAEDIVMQTVVTDKFVHPDRQLGGRIEGEYFVDKEGQKHQITSRELFYIPKANLSGKEISEVDGGKNARVERVAWAQFHVNAKTRERTEMTVYIRDDADPDKAAALVKKAFSLPDAKDSVWKSESDMKIIMDFVKAEVARYKGGEFLSNPHIKINLFIKKDSQSIKDPAAIVSLVTVGAPNGKKDEEGRVLYDAKPHEMLQWNYVQRKLEPTRNLQAGGHGTH
ncbi:MAG: hypothetical protein HY549_10735 [Elusimicrobia bacterium]|nr:hypothetical protein [Elusimicrobiota bacterium]